MSARKTFRRLFGGQRIYWRLYDLIWLSFQNHCSMYTICINVLSCFAIVQACEQAWSFWGFFFFRWCDILIHFILCSLYIVLLCVYVGKQNMGLRIAYCYVGCYDGIDWFCGRMIWWWGWSKWLVFVWTYDGQWLLKNGCYIDEGCFVYVWS